MSVKTNNRFVQQSNPVFSPVPHNKTRRLQRQTSFSGIAGKLMDAKSESSRKLSRQINKMARVQEEKERQKMREKEVAAEEEKKKKEEEFDRSGLTRKLSIFGSYRRTSFAQKARLSEEVSHSTYPALEHGGRAMPVSVERKTPSPEEDCFFSPRTGGGGGGWGTLISLPGSILFYAHIKMATIYVLFIF